MNRKRIIRILVMCAIAYVGFYAIIATQGGYRFDQSGLVRFSFGLSVSDIEMWHPKYAWFQSNFRSIDGVNTTRGNALGYFYGPLITLDRMFIHKTRVIEELRQAAEKKGGEPSAAAYGLPPDAEP